MARLIPLGYRTDSDFPYRGIRVRMVGYGTLCHALNYHSDPKSHNPTLYPLI